MIKLKRLILWCFMLTMCAGSTVAAEITCDVDNSHLKLSGNLGEDYAYRMISLQLNGPFESYQEFPGTVEDIGNNFEKLQKTEFVTLYLDENGEFSYDFYPQADNRFYAVAAYTHGFEKPWSKTILNVSDSLEEDVVTLLNGAETPEAIKNLFDNPSYYNVLTYDYSIFKNIKKEENLKLVYTALYVSKEDTPFENLADSYGNVIIPISAVMNINEMPENQMAEAKIMAENNIKLENAPLYNFYKDMEQSKQENVFKRLLGKNYSNEKDFIDSFDVAVFLQKLESEEFKNNITALLNNYATTYSVNISGYSSSIDAVNNALYKKYFKTTAELSEAIARAIRENPSVGGSTGGGAGGGGGGGAYVPPVGDSSKATPLANEIFNDLGSVGWAKQAIEALYELGVIHGRTENTFDPRANVKREEFVKMVMAATNKQQDGDTVNFTDVNAGEWYYPYIASGVKLGWVNGIDDTHFGVGAPLTRQDMAVFVDRALGIHTEISQEQFGDDSSISDYAKEAVYRLRNIGIISGDEQNRFNPKACATRAEAAKVIYEMIKKENK